MALTNSFCHSFFPTAACATEVFKIATRSEGQFELNIFSFSIDIILSLICQSDVTENLPLCCSSAYVFLNNYLVFNDVDGLYTYTFEAQRKVSRALRVISINVGTWGLAARSRRLDEGVLVFALAGKLLHVQPGASGPPVSSLSQTPGGVGLPHWERLSVST